jgi:O-antigen biosynthesis protein
VKKVLMAIANRIAPKFTTRRLVLQLMLTVLTRPTRIFERLNRENIFLYKQFGARSIRCGICGSSGKLYFDMPDRGLRNEHGIGVFRETLSCRFCGSTTRQRTLAYALRVVARERWGREETSLDAVFRKLDQVKIWDTDSYSPMSKLMRSYKLGMVSKYLPDRLFGSELESGVFNIDLQRIDFESNRFDVILSSDIMEHVPNDGAAHSEIFRCLKPGGAYIFTVPYDENLARTRFLVDVSPAGDLFLTRRHYHGDPITGGILAYRIYGRDLIDALSAIGFEVRFLWIEAATEGIFSGDCFIATKPQLNS